MTQQEFEGTYDRLEGIVLTLDPRGRNVGEGLVLRLYETCADTKPLRTVRAGHLALFTGRAEEVTFSFPSVPDSKDRRFCFALDLRGFAADSAPTVLRARDKGLAVPDPNTGDVVLFEDHYAFPLGSASRKLGRAVRDEPIPFTASIGFGLAAGAWCSGWRPARSPSRRRGRADPEVELTP